MNVEQLIKILELCMGWIDEESVEYHKDENTVIYEL